MPIKSTYRHYNPNNSNKRTFEVNTFKGVDYTPAQLNVADHHAVDISNIIYQDKVNQKRKGWQQIAQVVPTTYYVKNSDGTYTQKVNPTNVNAVWKFIGENNTEIVIAHIGKLLFKVEGFGKDKTFLDSKFEAITTKVDNKNVALELENRKSEAFYGHHRLYILGGNKYYVLKHSDGVLSLSEVEDDEETYIPTTTVGITYKDSAVDLAAPLDDVNLLTQWRKNKLVSGTYVDDGVSLRTTQYWDFSLDTTVYPKNETDINNIVINIQSLKEGE
jgi:hypothetical protein